MRYVMSFVAILGLLAPSVAFAQPVSFLSIPSSGFTPQTSEGHGNAGYGGNNSGTARLFDGSHRMFAPVNLPHGATVMSMRCGGQAPEFEVRIRFTLRRNEPQQANVDMATAMTTFDAIDFQFVEASSITSPVVDNAAFNYYIVAQKEYDDENRFGCSNCTVGFCRIGYSVDLNVTSESGLAPSGSATLHPSYPNPTAAGASLTYLLNEPAYVRLTVYDLVGREVARLVDGSSLAGEHTAMWDGRDAGGQSLSAGVYLVRLRTGGVTESRQVILLR